MSEFPPDPAERPPLVAPDPPVAPAQVLPTTPVSAVTGLTPSRPTLLWLLAALALLALVAMVTAWRANQRLANLEQELVRRQQESAVQANEARLVARDAQESVRDASAKVALLEARVAEVSVQRTQLEDLIQSLSRSRDENMLGDVEASIRVAQQQTVITGSAEPLVAALKQGDERLARYDLPRLENVRRAVGRDLDRIKAVSVADLPSLAIKVDEAIRLVDDLPLLASADGRREPSAVVAMTALRGTSTAASSLAAALVPAPSSSLAPASSSPSPSPSPLPLPSPSPSPSPSSIASPGATLVASSDATSVASSVAPSVASSVPPIQPAAVGTPASSSSSSAAWAGTATLAAWSATAAGWWHAATGTVWAEVRSLLRVSRVDHPDAMLLAPEQAFFVRENLKLRLLNARLALLSRQFDTAQSDLGVARAALERYFDRSVKRTTLAIELVAQVAAQARQVNVPRPDDTLAALTAAGAGR